MLEFVEKLTLTPSRMAEDDVQRLRAAGWTDRDILDIVHVCAYFNFRVRVVDGLGLETTTDMYEQGRTGRERASERARKKGLELPPDVWAVKDETAPSTSRG